MKNHKPRSEKNVYLSRRTVAFFVSLSDFADEILAPFLKNNNNKNLQ